MKTNEQIAQEWYDRFDQRNSMLCLRESILGALEEATAPAWTTEVPNDEGFYWLAIADQCPEIFSVIHDKSKSKVGLIAVGITVASTFILTNGLPRPDAFWLRITPPTPPKG